MKSMTGFSRAVVEKGGHVCTVEIRTVNHRFREISLGLPRQLQEQEAALRRLITDRLARGSISVSVSIDGHQQDLGVPVLNVQVSQGYLQALRDFQQSHGLGGEIRISDIANLPDLFSWDLNCQFMEINVAHHHFLPRPWNRMGTDRDGRRYRSPELSGCRRRRASPYHEPPPFEVP